MGIATENVIDATNVEHFLCSICTQLLEDVVIIRKCEHMFCRSCINQWIDQRKDQGIRTCPDCRRYFNDVTKPVRPGLRIHITLVTK